MAANKANVNNKISKISRQTHIIEDVGENGEMQYRCTACSKTFRSRSQRYYHINCNDLQKLIYKCHHCDKSFSRHTQWKYHKESHISPINLCQTCQKTFSNPLALKKHEALHEVEPMPCPQCDKTFKKKISLDHHIAAQHHNQLQYGCAFCNKKYSSKSSLQLHLQTHEKKRFECTFCGKLFQRNSILNLHLKRHYKTNSYICAICQKIFSESGALRRHTKIHEENVTEYYCKLCNKSIRRKDNMTRHLITIHPEEKFDNIVEIMDTPLKPTQQLPVTVENNESNLCNTNTKSNRKVLVIENKLLHKPLKQNEALIDLPKSLVTKTEAIEFPLINQIKVITAVSNYKREMLNLNIENEPHEITNQCKNTDYQQEDSMFREHQETSYKNYGFIKEGNKVAEQGDNNAGNNSIVDIVQSHLTKFNNTDQEIIEQDLGKIPAYFLEHKNELKTYGTANQQQYIENHESPLTQTFPSVIRSVGNVKKNFTTSHIDTLAKPISKTSLEYKHKKYCRNHYNIDLYRKILGCDEDDNDEDIEKKLHFDQMQKSSTPVHWRKCFKNNYETSVS